MTEADLPDDDALWRLAAGVCDPETDALRARIAAGDARLARDLAFLEEIRDLVRGDAAHRREPSARLRALTRDADADGGVGAGYGVEEWLEALPLGMVPGVRGGGATGSDSVFACVTQEFVLTVSLHPEGVPQGMRVEGQLARPDGGPYIGVAVTYEADQVPVAQAVTDELGEFAFEAHVGSDFALQLELEGRHRFVSVWREGDQD